MRWFLLAALLSFTPACKRPAATEGRLAAIEANLDSLHQLAGREGDIPFTAYFQQGDLQMIDEQPPERGAVHNRYYFHQGVLFYYRQLDQGRVSKQFVVDKNGLVKNTIPEIFPPAEYDRTTARGRALEKAALARAGQSFDFPLFRNR